VAGALPLDQATIERDLMRLADTPAKLKKSIFRTTVFRQSMRVYVTYGDLERRVLGICTTLTGWGDLVNGINAAEIAFLECMRAAGNQRRNNIR
jgi:hypothetical protein